MYCHNVALVVLIPVWANACLIAENEKKENCRFRSGRTVWKRMDLFFRRPDFSGKKTLGLDMEILFFFARLISFSPDTISNPLGRPACDFSSCRSMTTGMNLRSRILREKPSKAE
jgi:hypothetical protein